MGAARDELVEHGIGELQKCHRAKRNVAGVTGSGANSGMSSRLANASCSCATRAPCLLHAPQIGGLLVAMSCGVCRKQPLLLDEAVERMRGHRPGVALVFDESVQRPRLRWVLPSRSSSAHPSKAGAFGNGNDFGEESADLDFRIDPRLEPAKSLTT